jgi:hypothetical protein
MVSAVWNGVDNVDVRGYKNKLSKLKTGKGSAISRFQNCRQCRFA